MPTSFCTKHEIQELLAFAAAQSNVIAVTQALQNDLDEEMMSLDQSSDTSSDASEAGLDEEESYQSMLFSGLTLLGFAASLSGDGSRGQYNQFEKCHQFFDIALGWPDRHFRHKFRIGCQTFDHLVQLLEVNPLFHSTGRKPQCPVHYQLACFLIRYGFQGSDSLQPAYDLGMGALRQLGPTTISWGDKDRQKVVSDYILEHFGFPDCLGALDGTLIQLTSAPKDNGRTYYCRKKFPAINVQAIVDHEKHFIAYELGWPGSVPDVTVWKSSHVYKHRATYFEDGKYVMADKGYPSSPYVVQPFTVPDLAKFQNQPAEKHH
ncbi:hypothetical protein APHAL10511_003881 [Amanita phalloides]|nr:hypothetical protein APHAL10511_003881 [Amanita phalloides]